MIVNQIHNPLPNDFMPNDTDELYRVVKLLNEIGKDILSKLSTDKIVLTVYESINQLMDASIFLIGIYNPKRNGLDLWGINEKHESTRINFQSLEEENVWAVWCYNNQKEVLINDYDTERYENYFANVLFSETLDRKSFIYLPLTIHGKKIGIVSVQSYVENAYTKYHRYLLLNLANYITIALENADAYNLINEQNEELRIKSQALEAARGNLEEQVLIRTHELEAANKQLEMLSIVAKETDNAIMIMDNIGNILWVNDCFTRIYKYNYEEFVAARGRNILQTSFNPQIKETIERCLSEKKSVVYDALNITQKGGEVWTQTTLTPILDENGEVKNLVTIDSDITKVKQAEKKIIQQNRSITDSIKYARRIQAAVLPSQEVLNQMFKKYFVLYKPKDIISGDFYWAKRIKNYLVFAVADCTGHGVPGSFMSMLGISLLNEIIIRQKVMQASQVLNMLRDQIKSSLQQTGRKDEQKDGMDIALCIYDTQTGMLQFAGANNPLYIIRENTKPAIVTERFFTKENFVLYEIRHNPQPIGIYIREKPFTNNMIQILEGDKIYLSSDGLADQAGGLFNKKLLTRSVKQNLLQIHDKPFKEQEKLLNQVFTDWKGRNEQVDDVTIMGVQIS